ncbi:MAG: hypothetical protein K6G51_08015 [Sphaerochaetaceae bacterium]|nr:hypothetical protein [Sphaerochaetaceae bacterium]
MKILLIGIKGTGMSHLASYLKRGGHEILGMDVPEDFFTAPLIKDIDILDLASPLPTDVEKVIYSSAYESRSIKALEEAKRKSIVCLSYPEALSYLSKDRITCGISGTHGKTTTSAVASFLMEKLGIEGGSIYGSFLKNSEAVYHLGDRYLLLESCEYQEHFLLYELDVLVITNIDFDHPDYFKNLDCVIEAFHKRFLTISKYGTVIAHISTKDIVESWKRERSDISVIYYGEGTEFSSGILKIDNCSKTILEDYVAALLCVSVLTSLPGSVRIESLGSQIEKLMPLLDGYVGVSARSEVVVDRDGVLYIDEYAHHPREISVALENLRIRYPSRRQVVLFMPHTSSRTEALLEDFASSLSKADILILERVYGSARNDIQKEDSSLKLIKRIWEIKDRNNYLYIPTDEECIRYVASFLKRGDVCITMGAGNNRSLIDRIIELKDNI